MHEQERERIAKRERVRALGMAPYGARETNLVSLATARARYDAEADAMYQSDASNDQRPRVRAAGRVMLHRDNGKLIWMNLRDETADLQVAVSKRDCDEAGFALAQLTDLGDIVVVEGPVMKTRAGEVTIWASRLTPAAKCLVPPPEKHAGLQDIELRYRQRYVDLWSSPEAARVLRLRSDMISALRAFMDSRGFREVETPVLQTLAGGAAARPFVTHMNALDIDLYMRVAPELYLKRLLVGGMSRVYEVARNFRNEGLDRTHNPEFTMMEAYEAFGSYHTMMELTEGLIKELARVVSEESSTTDDQTPAPVDCHGEFERVTYGELFRRAHGVDMRDTQSIGRLGAARGLDVARMDHWLIVNALFDDAEDTIDPGRPTFVIDYPAALSPLTRPSATDPVVAERFELFIGGMEMANAYTELNDPDVQREKFEKQLAGVSAEEQTFRTLDEDFLRALRVGMPPAGGLGVGIDRVVMALTGQASIRDVLLFPLMRPIG
ncbi:MAG: lysine--tRNA ligase [Phycisphaeraceae bacterium]|nr:lysine--tRNA ligase [Phycisphaeraceae bacterium]